MFEVKILRSFKVQCLKILEQRIVEYVSESVASKDLPTGVDLGLFIGGWEMCLTFQSSNYFTAIYIPERTLLRNRVKRSRFVLKVLYDWGERNKWAI